MFARVEALPWQIVHDSVKEAKTWTGPAEYVKTLDSLPLGANVAAFIGHSDIRAAVLGLGQSVDQDYRPTRSGSRPDGADALRRARRGLRRALHAAQLVLETRRHSLSGATTALDLRHMAGIACAEQCSAATRTRASEHPELGTSGRSIALPRTKHRPRIPPAPEDDVDRGRRRQGRPQGSSVDPVGRWSHQPGRRQLSVATPAGAVRDVRRRRRSRRVRGIRIRLGRTQLPRRDESRKAARRRVIPPAIPQGHDQAIRPAGLESRLVRRRNRLVPRQFRRRAIFCRCRRKPRNRTRRRTARPDRRARRPATLANCRRQRSRRSAGPHATVPERPDRLLGFRCAPSQHGVLQLRTAHARTCPPARLDARRTAVRRLTGELADWYGLDAGYLRKASEPTSPSSILPGSTAQALPTPRLPILGRPVSSEWSTETTALSLRQSSVVRWFTARANSRPASAPNYTRDDSFRPRT